MVFEEGDMTKTLKKRILAAVLAALMLLIPLAEVLTPTAEAATKAAINKKAKKLYKKQLDKLNRPDITYYVYKYIDVTGDGIVEALVEYHPAGGSGRKFVIYSYDAGKLVKLCTVGEYGLDRIYFYKNGFIMHTAGHGHEGCRYYKKSADGKFRMAAMKGRLSEDGAEWVYTNRHGNEVTKATFDRLTRKIKAGSRKVLYPQKWTWVEPCM